MRKVMFFVFRDYNIFDEAVRILDISTAIPYHFTHELHRNPHNQHLSQYYLFGNSPDTFSGRYLCRLYGQKGRSCYFGRSVCRHYFWQGRA